MQETQRLVEAAAALGGVLRSSAIPHAFYGSLVTAVLSNNPFSDEILCIVEGGLNQSHPFRRVREAVSGNDDFSVTHSPWTNRLHVTYRRPIPSIDIEILPAGETGPRHLDSSTVMKVQNVPFLTVSEFIRAKLNSWVIRAADRDAQDITFVLNRYWNRVDINRIVEQDMNQFCARNPAAAPGWAALRRKYGM
ncbi:hypothetical protein CPB83DRAFT_768486 [Crepidotus variabilis]|uniref:Uncharacterized protein n=1 Tax=Crepidotus variabilis TaxID=179855 RepID=A0A9P6EE67_9AGAR|nr:hypothetical protein CPB83DRAFT_768486 [Crepidotus variabilis]